MGNHIFGCERGMGGGVRPLPPIPLIILFGLGDMPRQPGGNSLQRPILVNPAMQPLEVECRPYRLHEFCAKGYIRNGIPAESPNSQCGHQQIGMVTMARSYCRSTCIMNLGSELLQKSVRHVSCSSHCRHFRLSCLRKSPMSRNTNLSNAPLWEQMKRR